MIEQDRVRQEYLMVRRTMSQKAIAFDTGLSASTLSRLERGMTALDLDSLATLARYLGIHLSEGTITQPAGDTLAEIGKVIDADETLSENARQGLKDLMNAGYRELAKPERSRNQTTKETKHNDYNDSTANARY
jgi:transcriptional regulator with XRE-family HTH domain